MTSFSLLLCSYRQKQKGPSPLRVMGLWNPFVSATSSAGGLRSKANQAEQQQEPQDQDRAGKEVERHDSQSLAAGLTRVNTLEGQLRKSGIRQPATDSSVNVDISEEFRERGRREWPRPSRTGW